MRVLLFGCGAVGRALLLVIGKLNPGWLEGSSLVVVDREDVSSVLEVVSPFEDTSLVRLNVKPRNLSQLTDLVVRHKINLFVDATYGVDTEDLLKAIDLPGVLFINSSIEEWNSEPGSIWERQQEIKALNRRSTALVDMGINPGLISLFAAQGLESFAARRGVSGNTMEELARGLDIRAMIVSEKDRQVSSRPRQPGIFTNTWSPDGFLEEAFSPNEYTERNEGVVVESAYSYYRNCFACVPSGYVIGPAIRHSEAITLGEAVGGIATVFYCYQCCDEAMASLHEAQISRKIKGKRTMFSDIRSGTDEIGILLLSQPYGAWWYGSTQSIEQTRKLFPGYEDYINVTTLQTASGYFVGIDWIIRNPDRGICFPEEVDHHRGLELVKSLIAPVYNAPIKFSFADKPARDTSPEDAPEPYSFDSFVV